MRAGDRLLHYEILSPLGAGGMGQVYRARDDKLKREVALKLLASALADDVELLIRLQREAEVLAKLNHSSIATIYAVEDSPQGKFLVMELVPGCTLQQRLAQGALRTYDALRLCGHVAEGLEAAHAAGIVHRDLKPANVMLTPEGRVKLLDFGISKVAAAGPGSDARDDETAVTQLTSAGVLLGTAPYMSPEQVRGQPVDTRADIWAFGCLMFETLTGKRAFAASTVADTLSAVLEHDPDWGALPADVPDELLHLLQRCLRKDTTQRMRDIGDVRLEIEDTLTGQTPARDTPASGTPASAAARSARADVPGGRSALYRRAGPVTATLVVAAGLIILYFSVTNDRGDEQASRSVAEAANRVLAVLPFENLGPADKQYFTAGITEEIGSRLAALHSLAVISGSTTRSYDRTGKTLEQIGDDLHVDYVLEGTVRWARTADGTDRVRVTPRLVQVSSDVSLWSDSFERSLSLDALFAVQIEIAMRVIENLQVTLGETERQMVESRPTENLDAYQEYLRGLDLMSLGYYPGGYRLSIPHFRRAVQLDPAFDLARARLAQVLVSGSAEERTRCWDLAEELVATAPDYPYGHLALGFCHFYLAPPDETVEATVARFERALEQFRIADAALPNDADIATSLGKVMAKLGRLAEAVEWSDRAVRLDPRSVENTTLAGLSRLFTRDNEQADVYFRRLVELSPGETWVFPTLAANQIAWRGTAVSLEQELEAIEPPYDCDTALTWMLLEITRRDYQAVLDRLAAAVCDARIPRIGLAPYPLDVYAGLAHMHLGHAAEARAAFNAALELATRGAQRSPDGHYYHLARGLALAMLGRDQEALRAGAQGVRAATPWSADRFFGSQPLITHTQVLANAGEPEAALELLERLLARDSPLTVALIESDPFYDPLRDHPGFSALLDRHR